MRAALMSNLAHTQLATRHDRLTHAGSAPPRPPPKATALPKARSIPARRASSARPNRAPNGAKSQAMQRHREGLW